jgi:hypothetical protein
MGWYEWGPRGWWGGGGGGGGGGRHDGGGGGGGGKGELIGPIYDDGWQFEHGDGSSADYGGYRNAEEDWDESEQERSNVRWMVSTVVFVAFFLMMWSDWHSQPVAGFFGDARTRESWCIGVAEYADGSMRVGQHVDAQTCLGPNGIFTVDADHLNTHIRFYTRDERQLCLTDDRGDGTDWVTLEPCRQSQTNQKWTESTLAGGSSGNGGLGGVGRDGLLERDVRTYWQSVGAHLVGDAKQCLAVHSQHRAAGLRVFDTRLVMEPCYAGSIADRERRQIAFTPLIYDPSAFGTTHRSAKQPNGRPALPYYRLCPVTGVPILVASHSTTAVASSHRGGDASLARGAASLVMHPPRSFATTTTTTTKSAASGQTTVTGVGVSVSEAALRASAAAAVVVRARNW